MSTTLHWDPEQYELQKKLHTKESDDLGLSQIEINTIKFSDKHSWRFSDKNTIKQSDKNTIRQSDKIEIHTIKQSDKIEIGIRDASSDNDSVAAQKSEKNEPNEDVMLYRRKPIRKKTSPKQPEESLNSWKQPSN